MRLTDYSRDQIQQFIKDGICEVQALRDYEILKQIENREKITHIALDHNISRRQVHNIRNKYDPKV